MTISLPARLGVLLLALSVPRPLAASPAQDALHVLRHGDRHAFELGPGDPAAVEGKGPARTFTWVAESRCAGYLWVRSERCDPFMRVRPVGTDRVLDDEDGGGGTSAWMRLEAEPGDEVLVTVALASGEQGEVLLALTEVPRLPEELYAELAAANAQTDEAKRLLAAGGRAESWPLVASSIPRLSAMLGERDGLHPELYPEEVVAGLWKAGEVALALEGIDLARAAWEPVLASRLATLPEEHRALSDARGNVALALRASWDLEGAAALEELALAARERVGPETHPFLQRARRNLALTYKALGRYEEARALEEQVVEVLGRNMKDIHPRLWEARLHLAGTLLLLGDGEAAHELAMKVVPVMEERLGPEHLDLMRARLVLARCLRALGRLDEAAAVGAGVLAVFMEEASGEHPYVQQARLDLARTRLAQGKLDEARELAEAAVFRMAGDLPAEHPELVRARVLLGDLAVAEGTLDLALAIRRIVYRASASSFPRLHPDRIAAIEDLADVLERTGAAEEAAERRAEAARLEAERASSDAAGPPSGKDARAVGGRDLGELAAALPAGTALLVYSEVQDDALAAGAHRSERAITCAVDVAGRGSVGLGGGLSVFEAVRGWLDAVRDADDAETAARGARLRELVLDPALELAGTASRIVVVPAGHLERIPFDALPGRGGGLVGDELEVVHVPALELLERAPPEPGHLLLIAGCFRSPHTPQAREAELVAEICTATRAAGIERLVVEQEDVKPLAELARRARYFHLATSGWIEPDGPAPRGSGGVPLCLGPGDAGRRVLTTNAVRDLDLSRCELAAVTSGTSLGGVMRFGRPRDSFQVALHEAGARLVLGSLWTPHARHHVDLVAGFYRGLWERGLAPHRALWEAKQVPRRAGVPPRAWAGWVLTGY